MDTRSEGKPVGDLRDYLAEERTFLAWVRTGIALMGFGLVVAHIGIVAGEAQPAQHASGIETHDPSLWFGMALVAIGVGVNLFSARRYMRLVGELNRGRFVRHTVSKQGVVVAVLLALLGIAITIYVILVAVPPDALHAWAAHSPAEVYRRG